MVLNTCIPKGPFTPVFQFVRCERSRGFPPVDSFWAEIRVTVGFGRQDGGGQLVGGDRCRRPAAVDGHRRHRRGAGPPRRATPRHCAVVFYRAPALANRRRRSVDLLLPLRQLTCNRERKCAENCNK